MKKLEEADIPTIYTLCQGNPLYYKFCPPDKTPDDKYYIGFYQAQKLIAVMDIILGFPTTETAFIGFFMMDKEMQGKNIGTSIISECCINLHTIGFSKIRLGYVRDNLQSELFWLKNHFHKTGDESIQEQYTVVHMMRTQDK